jgi:hypothetical protein
MLPEGLVLPLGCDGEGAICALEFRRQRLPPIALAPFTLAEAAPGWLVIARPWLNPLGLSALRATDAPNAAPRNGNARQEDSAHEGKQPSSGSRRRATE